VLKDKIKKKIQKNNPSQLVLTCQTRVPSHETKIIPYKVNKKIMKSNSQSIQC